MQPQTLTTSDLTVLLIEPSKMQQKILAQQLRDEGIEKLELVGSQQEAWEKITKYPPDLIVSNLHYKDGSAHQLLASLRAAERLEGIPFVLISSEERREQLESFKQSGVVAILPKPVQTEKLQQALTSTLSLLSDEELELELYDLDLLRVLVVDDSKLARKAVVKVLDNLGVLQENIVQCDDGSRAIEYLQQHEVDLVVTDYNMPEVNGIELTKHIRANIELTHLPVLMITSEANDDHLSQVFQAGVSAISNKPFKPEKIKSILQELLG